MNVVCPHCQRPFVVPQPGYYTCPNCHGQVALAAPMTPSGQPIGGQPYGAPTSYQSAPPRRKGASPGAAAAVVLCGLMIFGVCIAHSINKNDPQRGAAAAARAEEKEKVAAAAAAEREAAVDALPQRIAELDEAMNRSDWGKASSIWNEAYPLANEDIKAQLDQRRGTIEDGLHEDRAKEVQENFSKWTAEAESAVKVPEACQDAEKLKALLDGMGQIKEAEIGEDARASVTKLLVRLEKCRKSAAAKVAKIGRAEGVEARAALASTIEATFLQNRIDVDVRVKGNDKTTLWMQWIWNRVTIGDFETTEAMTAIRAAGFKKIHYDAFMAYYTTTIAGADWGEKKVREAGLDRAFEISFKTPKSGGANDARQPNAPKTLADWRGASEDARTQFVTAYLAESHATADAVDTKMISDCIGEFAARPERNKGVDVLDAAATCAKVPSMARRLVGQ